jgi:hypothetical protein
MVKRRRKRRRYSKRKPTYALADVKKLISEGKVLIRNNALYSARRHFGWESDDILDAMKKLARKHYHKTEESEAKPSVMLDFYKAPGLKGEDVFTHFYVDRNSGRLIINSFKKLRS